MKHSRSEGLARLHTWAHGSIRDERLKLIDLIDGSAAMEHGMNAVRAIDRLRDLARFDSYDEYAYIKARTGARLAVRSALSAVGLRTL